MHTKKFTFNLASGNANQDLAIAGFPPYSLQAIWSGLTGTPNGTVKIKQSNDGINFDQLKTMNAEGEEVDFGIDIDSAGGSDSLEDKLGFSGVHMRIAVAVGSITAGTLTVILNQK